MTRAIAILLLLTSCASYHDGIYDLAANRDVSMGSVAYRLDKMCVKCGDEE